MKKIIFTIALMSTILLNAQSDWKSPNFTLEYYPHAGYWDTIDGWFYLGGQIINLNGSTAHRMIRIDSFGVPDRMDTIQKNTTTLTLEKYLDTIYNAGYEGLYTYENGSWKEVLGDLDIGKLITYNGEMYIGGSFINSISQNDGYIIKYDGNHFSPFSQFYTYVNDSAFSPFTYINDMEVFQGDLYICGQFYDPNMGKLGKIMKWDGSNFSNLDAKIQGDLVDINSLCVYGDKLFVGGKFNPSDGIPTNNIASWNGSEWEQIGQGIFGFEINDMKVFQGELWVGGELDSVPGLPLSHLVTWNGNQWCRPQGQFSNQVKSISEFLDTLFVGGVFNEVDGDTSIQYLAIYLNQIQKTCGALINLTPLVIDDAEHKPTEKYSISPNPNTGIFQLNCTNCHDLSIQILNSTGQKQDFHMKNQIIEFSGSPGLYFLYLMNQDDFHVVKVVLSN